MFEGIRTEVKGGENGTKGLCGRMEEKRKRKAAENGLKEREWGEGERIKGSEVLRKASKGV